MSFADERIVYADVGLAGRAFGGPGVMLDCPSYTERDEDGDGAYERKIVYVQDRGGNVVRIVDSQFTFDVGSTGRRGFWPVKLAYTAWGEPALLSEMCSSGGAGDDVCGEYFRLDCDNDGEVDGDDLACFMGAQPVSGGGTLPQPPPAWDFNSDGVRDSHDEAMFVAAFHGTLAPPTFVLGEYRFLYRGYMYDAYLGLYHVRHRDYDPRLRRWLQLDPAGFVDGFNRYAYCGNDPLNKYDPMGLYWRELWDGFVSILVVDPGGARTFIEDLSLTADLNIQRGRVPDRSPQSNDSIDRHGAAREQQQADLAQTGRVVAKALDTTVRVAFPAADAVDGIATAVENAAKNPNAKNLAVLPLVVVIEALPGPDGGVGSKVGRALTGDMHHVISSKVWKALERHETLGSLFKNRDAGGLTQALDKAAHNGYQTWHRDYDKEIVKWLEDNRNATPEQFKQKLQEIYDRDDMKKRFPNGLPECSKPNGGGTAKE